MDMKQKFKDWLSRQYKKDNVTKKRFTKSSIQSYVSDINRISKHYPKSIAKHEKIDIYSITNTNEVRKILGKYKPGGLKPDGKDPTRYISAVKAYFEFLDDEIKKEPESSQTSEFHFHEKISPQDVKDKEGAFKTVIVNRYERSRKARLECLKYYRDKGAVKCEVCSFDFEKIYGERGKDFIHIHHKIPISDIKKEYEIDYKEDLIPVCPNCHAMIHRTRTALSIENLKQIINKTKRPHN